jgi:hypothetical protein
VIVGPSEDVVHVATAADPVVTSTGASPPAGRPVRTGAKRGGRRASSTMKYAYDIDKWTPDRLTHRNWFLVLVVLINLPTIAYQIYVCVPLIDKVSGHLLWLISAIIALEAMKILALIGVWFLSKLAAEVYLGALVAGMVAMLLIPSVSTMALTLALAKTAFHAGMFLLAIRSLWKPAFLPQHIKDKFGLS